MDKEKIYKILHPKVRIILLLVLSTIILLIYSLGTVEAFAPVKYFSYLYSTYVLVIVIINFKRFSGFIKLKINSSYLLNNIKNTLYRNRHIKRYFHDKRFSNMVNLYVSVLINVIFIFIKLREGIIYRSIWFISSATYYILLSVTKFFLLMKFNKKNGIEYEYKVYKITGCFLMLLNLVLAGMIVQMIIRNIAVSYNKNLVYASALYSFYLIISTVVNVVKYKKFNSPILSSVKIINLFTACVSILMLQTTMIATFSNDRFDFMQLMNGITGTVIVVIILAISTYMIVKGNKVSENSDKN